MSLRWLLVIAAMVSENAGRLGAVPSDGAGYSDPRPGVVRVAGNAELAGLVARWTANFERENPGCHVHVHLSGSDAGMAALYAGRADLALLGRAPTPVEIQAFEWVHRYKPVQVEILNGSLDRPGRSPALAVFVHRDNPLARLTLVELAEIFGAPSAQPSGFSGSWGDFGLGGSWMHQPIRLYGPDSTSGTGRFFRHVVLQDSRMLNWERLQEFSDTADAAPDATRKTLAALAEDRFGLAVAPAVTAPEGVKMIPLAGAEGEAVWPTRSTVEARSYPLTRVVVALSDRPPGKDGDAATLAFLRYIVSPAGQAEVATDDGYLALQPSQADLAARELSSKRPSP